MTSTQRVVAAAAASGALYGATSIAQRTIAIGHAADPRELAIAALVYMLATLALFAIYVAIVRMAISDSVRGRASAVALAVPLVFNAALIVTPASLSIDTLTYVAHGYQLQSGQNPYAAAVRALAPTPRGRELTRHGWIPVHGVSPYGPLWTGIEAAAAGVSSDVVTSTRAIKTLVAASSIGSAVLIWLILGTAAPRLQLAGTLLYAWNPVVVMEFAAEGHNDALMIFFVLLSLFLWTRRRPAAGIVAVALGALVKIAAALPAPLEIVYAWRTYPNRRRLIVAVLAGTTAAVATAVVLFAPVWIGAPTFDGLRTHSRPAILPSTQGVLYWYLTRSHSEAASARLISLASSALFIAVLAIAASRVTDKTTLFKACGRVAIAYVLLAPGYWPWYAALPIALLALAPDRMAVWSIVAISLAARLAAPIDELRLGGFMDWETEVFAATIVGVWLPAAAIGIAALFRRRPVTLVGLEEWYGPVVARE